MEQKVDIFLKNTPLNEVSEFLQCIQSLKIEFQNMLFSGKKWIFNTEKTVFPEAEESKHLSLITEPDLDLSCIKKETSCFQEENILTKSHPGRDTFAQKKSPSLTIDIPQPEDTLQKKVFFVRLCPSEEEITGNLPYSDEAGVMLSRIIDNLVSKLKWNDKCFVKTYLYKSSALYIPDIIEEHKKAADELFDVINRTNGKIIICWGERVSQILSGLRKPIEELREMNPYKTRQFIFMFFWDAYYILKKSGTGKSPLKNCIWNDLKKIKII